MIISPLVFSCLPFRPGLSLFCFNSQLRPMNTLLSHFELSILETSSSDLPQVWRLIPSKMTIPVPCSSGISFSQHLDIDSNLARPFFVHPKQVHIDSQSKMQTW